MPFQYPGGEDVRAGDSILLAGAAGRVVFVVGSGEIPADWAAAEKALREEHGEGFMLDVEGSGLLYHSETKDLAPVGRS